MVTVLLFDVLLLLFVPDQLPTFQLLSGWAERLMVVPAV